METMMEINEVGDLIRACQELQFERFRTSTPWFRGNAKGQSWRLVPSVFRLNNYDESAMARQFRLRAPSRREGCPAEEDLPSWLCLMRHYGLPTRLLDWTESILIAAFFAVCEDDREVPKEPAAIWALNPFKLNEVLNQTNAILLFSGNGARALAKPAFCKGQFVDTCFAIQPAEIDARMMLQQSMFTIHGSPHPLDELPRSQEFVARLEIPIQCRATVAYQLRMLGVTRSKVFPELDQLARDLEQGQRKSMPAL